MKQYYCFLERFNNYFNRKIIKYESLIDYQNHSKDSFIPTTENGAMTPFDFNPNDNVTTEIIANSIPFDPDYFLLLDENSNIIQRWFILEQKRNRQGQWLYKLKRDVISDNLNNLINSPIFVQKGMLHENDPMIFNDEGMNFNQVKRSETLLKDRTRSSWIICYLAKSLGSSNVNINLTGDTISPDYVTLNQIAFELGISESELVSALNFSPSDTNKLIGNSDIDGEFTYHQSSTVNYKYGFKISYDFTYTEDGHPASPTGNVSTYLFSGSSSGNLSRTRLRNNIESNSSALKRGITAILGRNYYLQTSLINTIKNNYNGKIVLYLGNYYTLNITSGGAVVNNKVFKPSLYSEWNNVCELTEQPTDPYRPITYNSANGEIDLDFNEVEYRFELSAYTPATRDVKLTISSSRKVTKNQEYDIIAIPASSIAFYTSGTDFVMGSDLAQKIASALAIKEGTNIYDVQLLPYCPRLDMATGDNVINTKDFTEHEDFDYIVEDDNGNETNIGAVLYVEEASFVGTISHSLTITEGMKIDSLCNFYRLVSPNYQGSFEFNVAKNGGTVDFFTYYCTYKPYTPFIKVTPFLNNLYGKDYNDNRGLICGGDFSLPRASSAWQQYQLENKNYQNIFNREIQNLNFMQSIEMRNQLISGAVGILSDTVKGAGAGAYVGGGVGAMLGGMAGGALSTVGYAVDVDTLSRQHKEIRELSIDKFNYQLGNVKALPYTLTKVGAFDISSKIFPFLEYYSCTDKEKDALRNKILYESMTVMRIGTLYEFMNFDNKLNYFKGELIRNDIIADDPHTLNAIYDEFLKGVYI